jgi:ketosteroid isomerase-like protein
MMEIIEQYCEAFGRKDLRAVAGLLTEDVVLEDPFCTASGKPAVLAVYRGLFANDIRRLDVLRSFRLNDSMIAFEFELELVDPQGATVEVIGVDCLTLREGRICHLRAYLAE